MPISSLSRRMSDLPASTSLPSNVMRPADGGSIQLMHRTSVLLPEPDGPIKTSRSLKSMSKLTPLMTSREPNDLCKSSMASRFPCDIIVSPAISLHLLFQVARPLHDRRGHDQVNQSCADVRGHNVISAGADDLRIEEKILHRDEGDQGSILDQSRKLICKRWQHSSKRLREDNVAQCLRPAHTQRESSFRLSLGDRFYSRSEDLGYVGCIAYCQRNRSRRELRQVQARPRESIVPDQDQQQSRRSAHNLDVDARNGADDLSPKHVQQPHQQSSERREDHRHDRERKRGPCACQEERQVFEDDRPLKHFPLPRPQLLFGQIWRVGEEVLAVESRVRPIRNHFEEGRIDVGLELGVICAHRDTIHLCQILTAYRGRIENLQFSMSTRIRRTHGIVVHHSIDLAILEVQGGKLDV